MTDTKQTLVTRVAPRVVSGSARPFERSIALAWMTASPDEQAALLGAFADMFDRWIVEWEGSVPGNLN